MTTARDVAQAAIIAGKPFRWRDRFPHETGASPKLRDRVLRDWSKLFDTLEGARNGR